MKLSSSGSTSSDRTEKKLSIDQRGTIIECNDPNIVFLSGAVRESAPEMPAFELICPAGLRRLALRYSLGIEKYGHTERGGDNYTAGIPASIILRHIYNHLNLYESGDLSDDHLAAACWGLFALIHFQEGCKHYEVRQDREGREPNPGRDGNRPPGS